MAGVEVAAVIPEALLEAARPALLRRLLDHVSGTLCLLEAGGEVSK